MDNGRESREFWYLNFQGSPNPRNPIVQVTGYACPPGDMWWCPSVGMSASVGHHLFNTRDETVAAAKNWIAQTRADLNTMEEILDG